MTIFQETLLNCGEKEIRSPVTHKPPDWDTLRETMLKISKSPIVVIDTETTGVKVGDSVRLLQVGISNGGGLETFIFDFYDYDDEQKKYIVNILLNYSDGVLIFHNAVFDLTMLYPYGQIKTMKFNLFDTMVAEKILDFGLSRKGFSLGDLAEKYMGLKIDKTEQKGNWSATVLSDRQIEYAKRDIEITYELYNILRNKLKELNLIQPFEIDINSIPAIVKCIYDGIYLDFQDWNSIAKKLEQDYNELENQIFEELGYRVNLNSPIQLKEALEKLLGIEIQTTGKDYLDGIKDKHKIIPLLIEFKVISKKLSSFGEKYEKYKGKDGRLHPKYNLIGTATGRLSCNNPNIQQVPREQEYRSCFKAQDGNVLIKADYSQIELRIATHLSQDPIMLQAYKNGEDLHILSASRLLGIPKDMVTKEQRNQAKSFNFGFLYSMGAKTFREYARVNFGMDISLGKAEVFKKRFFSAYVGLKDWHKRLERADYSITMGGRIRKYGNGYVSGELYNTPVQGTGADILKVALFEIYKNVLINTLRPAKIVGIVHDEVVLECLESDADKVAGELKKCMVTAWKQFIKDVPIDVDVQIGKTWGG